jgi:hypothetical protein
MKPWAAPRGEAQLFVGLAILLLIRWQLHPVYLLAIGAAAGSAGLLA